MAEVFPTSLKHRTTPNLRLGIKSSCGDLKSIIAALYIIFKSTKTPENITYSKEKVLENGSIGIELTEELASTISATFPNIVNVVDKVNSTPLFTRQCEPLQVAIELFFNLGRLKFTDNGHSERTGKNRYKKTLMFSDKMIVIDAYLSAFNPTERDAFLSLWLEEKHDHKSSIEDGFKQILSTFTIDCCYKIKREEGNELIFNLENIYEELANNNDVLFKENGQETVGPTRVLCSYIKEHMSYDIACHNEKFIAKEGRNEYLKMHYGLISNTLDLINRELPFNDVAKGNDIKIETDKEIVKEKFSPFITTLRTKPFLLLAGISGTGKSRIVRELAFKSCPDYLRDKDGTTPGNYCMVEVKPNWHDSTELLGYWSNINKRYMFTKFVKFLVKAKMFPEVPFFVCLDEMNLAPVEQYFAEFLSVLETRRLIKNDEGEDEVVSGVLVDKEYFAKLGTLNSTSGTLGTLKTDRDIYFKLFDIQDKDEMEKVENDSDSLLTEGLTLPENVFIVGTVNMDDTTHQFSRKVIDRAMTIEMNGGALADIFKHGSDLTYADEPMTMDDMRSRYISASEVLEKCQTVVNSQEISDYIQGKGEEGLPQRLEEINKVLRGTPFTVSYRVMNELTIYLAVLLDKAVEDGTEVTADNFKPYVEEAIDRILLMKILPRVEGDDEMFRISDDERTLNGLNSQVDENGTSHEYTKLDWLREIAPQHTAEDEKKYMAVDKLKEMIGRLNRQSFTRYWP